MRVTILLTSCIDPGQFIDSVKRNQIKERLGDYLWAIEKWNNHHFNTEVRILFIDNSSYPLQKIIEHMSPKLNSTVISIKATQAPAGMHYGYSELELIQNALSIKEYWDDEDCVIKITGRLYYPKLNKLIVGISGNSQWISDIRGKGWFRGSIGYIPSSVFAFKVKFFKKYFGNGIEEMNKMGISHLELFLYNKILTIYKEKREKITLKLPFGLLPKGIGAHWNKPYNSYMELIKGYLRSLLRVFFPKFWI